MKLTNITIYMITITFVLSGCSLMPDRTFVDNMEYEPESFFVPDQDFKVIVGDSGTRYRSKMDIMRRTPASDLEMKYTRNNNILEKELLELEESQDEKKYNHYLKYRDQLGNISNKIFFLKIPSLNAREDYLYNLGIYESPYHTSPEETIAIKNSDVLLGMSKESVVQAWGQPERIEVAGNPGRGNERWAYFTNGRRKFIYFTNGVVEGWENDSGSEFDF